MCVCVFLLLLPLFFFLYPFVRGFGAPYREKPISLSFLPPSRRPKSRGIFHHCQEIHSHSGVFFSRLFPERAVQVQYYVQYAQPPTVVCKMEAQSEYYVHARCMHIFARLAPICVLSRCLLTKFLRTLEISREFIQSALLVGCALSGPCKLLVP